MKNLIMPMLYAVVSALAPQASAAPQTSLVPTLVPGSEVKLEALTSAKWIQGEPIKAFEPGKVYMFECWATWCGPCVAAIPHVNELHKKYQDKGLRVVGVNVWEDGLEKVEKFVKGKGEGMSYPVVYTGKGSAFETEWLKPAGVTGIPRALIVKDGKLVLGTHPSRVNETLIEALLAGGDEQKKAIDEIASRESAGQKMMPLMRSFAQASRDGDVAAMEKTVAEVEAVDPKMIQLPMMKAEVLVVKKDFDAAAAALAGIGNESQRNMAYSMFANKIAMAQDPGAYPPEFIKSIAKNVPQGGTPGNPMSFINLAILQSKAGDKDAALKSAKSAAAAAGEAGPRKLPAAPFEKFVKAVEDGSVPTLGEFYQWMSVEMKASREAAKPAAPAKPAEN